MHQDQASIVDEGPLDENLRNHPFIQYILWAINLIDDSLPEGKPIKSNVLEIIQDPGANHSYPAEYYDIEFHSDISTDEPKHDFTANQRGDINVRGTINSRRYATMLQANALGASKQQIQNAADQQEENVALQDEYDDFETTADVKPLIFLQDLIRSKAKDVSDRQQQNESEIAGNDDLEDLVFKTF